jgi:hypothetical protein
MRALVGQRLRFHAGAADAAATVVAQAGRAVRVDRPFAGGGAHVAARRERPAAPALAYVQGNGQLRQGPGAVKVLRAAGALLGLAVSNRCCLSVALPPLFFAALVTPA